MLQVRKNLVTNILCLIVNILVGLLYTPYLVEKLGVATYGILPIALVVNQYILILTDSLQNSVTRFYSVEYREENYKKASVYFSSAIAIAVLAAFVVIPMVAFLLPGLKSVLNIPVELSQSASKLILYTVSSLFIAVCSNCVNITIYSDNRLDLINYLKIVRNLAKLLLNILLFTCFSTDVSNVGLASFLSELLVLGLSVFFYKKTKHQSIHFNWDSIDFASMKPIVIMLTWVSLISFSSVFIYKIDALLVNHYFGLYYTGVLGSISEFGSYCISITGIIGVLYRPLMLIAYSNKRHDELVKIALDSSYIVGLLSSTLCGIIMGLSSPLLNIWLNEDIAQYSLWMVIKMSLIPITTFGSVFGIVYNLWNRVKISAVWSLIISVVYVLLSLVLLESGMGMLGFLILGSIAAISQGAFMHILIYCKIYPNSLHIIFAKLVKCMVYFIAVFSISSCIEFMFSATTLFAFIIEIAVAGLVSLFLLFFFMNRNDLDALDIVIPIKMIQRKLCFLTSKKIKE